MDDVFLLLLLVPVVLLVLSIVAIAMAARALSQGRRLELAVLGLQAELSRRSQAGMEKAAAPAAPRPWERVSAATLPGTGAGDAATLPGAEGATGTIPPAAALAIPRPAEAVEGSHGRSDSAGERGAGDDALLAARAAPDGGDPAAPGEAPSPAGAVPPRRGLEEAILLRWGVWLGAAALALAAVFLVRTALDEGWLGPEARCALAALGGLALVGGAEWLARRPAKGALPDFAPAGLAAGGVATLFAAGYAATALYGLLGPLTGFGAMSAVGVAGILLALRFGPAVGLLGLAGAFVTPILVQTEAPSLPGLFGYLLVVVAAAMAVVRRTAWAWLGWCAVAGGAAWVLIGNALAADEAGGMAPDTWAIALFVPAAAALHLWSLPGVALDRPLGRRLSVVPVLALGLAAGFFAVDTASVWPAVAILTLAAVAIARAVVEPRLILAPAAGALLGLLLLGWWALPWPGAFQPVPEAVIEPVVPFPVIPEALDGYVAVAAILAAMFLISGTWLEGRGGALFAAQRGGVGSLEAGPTRAGEVTEQAGRNSAPGNAAEPSGPAVSELPDAGPTVLGPPDAGPAAEAAAGRPVPGGAGDSGAVAHRAAIAWAGLAAAVPVLVLLIAYARIGGFVADGRWALGALALAALSVGMTARAMRAGREPAAGAHAAAAVAAVALGCAMILRDQWLSVAVSLTLPPLALIAGRTGLRALRGVAAVVAAVVLVRLLLNPSVLDYALGGQVVLNGLLPAYGLPALACLLAAWWFRRDGDDGAVALLEAGGAALLSALVLLEVHHGFDPGFWLDEGAFRFRELAIHVAALSAMALVALYVARRTGRIVACWAWRLLGGAAVLLEVWLIVLNPGVTGEAVGATAVANALLPAFLLPALAAAAALGARETARPAALRPVLGVLVLVATLVWSTLEVRHGFHGDALELLSGEVPVEEAELWVWSGAWAALGVAALLAGLRLAMPALRWAGLALVALTAAKAFLVDIAALGGLWRVLSFLGLGLVLIGLGAAYRRLLPAARGGAEAGE
ncbi:DUF2339 domain-containing protein [Roseomonas elaeocarpi]|uniref:DUF2339 domain-containing protein n=1 Tax=Roseomonas elaeocarpi TaxID=907779 RepID=A0ABV6JV08_9PROT